ncbi:1601_t:CDS:2 [Entrophospora sp. SA101]|nr:1601_t:CDS:2 [Entrophospora sp. SA101]
MYFTYRIKNHQQSKVWVHFIKEHIKNSKGYFSVKCLYCPKKFQHGEASRLVAHLAKY